MVCTVPDLDADDSDYNIVCCGLHLLVSNGCEVFKLMNNNLIALDIPSQNLYSFEKHFAIRNEGVFQFYDFTLQWSRELFRVAEECYVVCAEGGILAVEYSLCDEDEIS